MGLMESSGEDPKKYGLRIYTIIKNGPLDKGGAQELTDFIIPPEEIYNNQINFQEWVHSHANQEITLSLYSLLTKKFRDIKIVTNPIGSKDGVIGASVKKENWTIANKNVLHIISVAENSFAQKELGLIPFEDYIIGVKTKKAPIIPLNQDGYTPLEILGEIIQENKGKKLKFYIYNTNKGARDVTVTIGDDYYFSLGCEGAFGALHMFPTLEAKESKIDNNIEETEKLIKDIKESINNIKKCDFMQQKNNINIDIQNIPNKINESTNINTKIDKNKEAKGMIEEITKEKKEEYIIEKGKIEKENNYNDKNINEEKSIQKNEEPKKQEIEQNYIRKNENDNINKMAEEISVQKELENAIENEEIKEKINGENQKENQKEKQNEIKEEVKEEIKEEKINEEINPENLIENQIKYKENEKEDNNKKEIKEKMKEEVIKEEIKGEEGKEEIKDEERKEEEEEIKGEINEEIKEEEKENENKNENNNSNNNISQNKSKKRKKNNRH